MFLANLEPLCSFEELRKLILSNIHFTGVHKLQDRSQVLNKLVEIDVNGTLFNRGKDFEKTWKGTSLRMMIGCLAGFSSSRVLK